MGDHCSRPPHSCQDFLSTLLQLGLRPGDTLLPPVQLLLLLLLLLLDLLLLLLPAPPSLQEGHVQVPEVAAAVLGLGALHELRVEGEVVADAVLPLVVRDREERETGAARKEDEREQDREKTR